MKGPEKKNHFTSDILLPTHHPSLLMLSVQSSDFSKDFQYEFWFPLVNTGKPAMLFRSDTLEKEELFVLERTQ